MPHSVFLSNISSPEGLEANGITMMKWGYEMPLLLQPLLISGGFVDNDLIYYDATPGIENLKRFYNFLDTTTLIDHKDEFTVCKDELFAYLDSLEYPYFCLDAREATTQPAIWLADIAYNNAMLTRAMDNNDSSLLDYQQCKHVSTAFQSFADLLNFAGYQYGWAYILQKQATIYSENGLWGLKSPAGEILLPPQFEEFYEFGEQGIAVVMKGNKYGYVHISGEVIAQPEWDEAYDFDPVNMAIVQRNGLLGLINISGEVVVAPAYENITRAAYNYIAQTNGKWGVLSAAETVLISFKYDQITPLQDGVFMLQKDGQYSLTEDGDQFDLMVRKAPPQGFAWAFKGADVYLIDQYGISRANKDLVKQDIDNFPYPEGVHQRLLAYAMAPAEATVTDDYTPVEELYNMGVDAYNRQDYPSAIYYYTLAAEKGYGYAMNNLAHIYYMVDGYIDEVKAFYWYNQGAVAGNTNAINGLSLCYQYGIGTAPDIEKAIDLLQQAAEDGLAVAHNNLGYLLAETDPARALYHYQQAAALGEPDYGWLGYLHEEMGEFETAVQYYQQDKTETGAFNLGNLLQKGLGTPKDVKGAIGYFKTAIAGGYDRAHIELARIYLSEAGFIDQDKAKEHILAATQAGIEIPGELQ